MNIDQDMLDDMWSVLHNRTMRDILKMIGIDGAITYTELRKSNGFMLTSSGKTAYFVKKLVRANMLKKDMKTKKYFLTRIGVESLSLVEAFDHICVKFDLSDCNADGRVETKIVIEGRKGEEDIPKEDEIKCIICPHTAKSVKSIRIHHSMKHSRIR